jgi:hypothetical protein
VFASIQSLQRQAGDLGTLAPDHFDVVIVDEFGAPPDRAGHCMSENSLR